MSELWYQNPKVLLDDMSQFIPSKEFNRVETINALARLSIYYSILIILLNQDTKWLSVGIVILLISLFLGTSEKFTSISKDINKPECQRPTKDNPFMNYTLGDLLTTSERPGACNYENVKKEIRQEFRNHTVTDSSDIWGKYISDRNFYTMPNTEIVNDQVGFAEWCFGNSGECKTTGNNCLKIRDPTYHRGRMTTVE